METEKGSGRQGMGDSRAQRDRKWRERQEVERERQEVDHLGQWKWKWPAGANVPGHPFASWTLMQGDEETFSFYQKNWSLEIT